jgi:hypothetical protein
LSSFVSDCLPRFITIGIALQEGPLGDAIGQILPSAVGVAISPIPIVGVVLMLVTPRAGVNGPAFVLERFLGILLVGGAVLLFASGVSAEEEGEPETWVGVLKLLLVGRCWPSPRSSGKRVRPAMMCRKCRSG